MENEITGNYPIIFGGVTAGEISVTREGLFWIFDAKCQMQEDIVRLSVFGNGQEAYLGVMEPKGDILTLTKKLSRTAVRDFPEEISFGGIRGEAYEIVEMSNAPYKPNATTESENVSLPVSDNSNNDVDYTPLEENIPPPARIEPPQHESAELNWLPCPCPCSLFSGITEKIICSYITGAFSAHVDDGILLAIPESNIKELTLTNSFHFINKIIFFDEIYQVFKIDEYISEL